MNEMNSQLKLLKQAKDWTLGQSSFWLTRLLSTYTGVNFITIESELHP